MACPLKILWRLSLQPPFSLLPLCDYQNIFLQETPKIRHCHNNQCTVPIDHLFGSKPVTLFYNRSKEDIFATAPGKMA